MAKFHVNPKTGDPGTCRANNGNCPFGGEEAHYTSREAAQHAYEQKMDASETVDVSTVGHRDVISLINDATGERILDEEVNFTGYDNLISVPSGSPTNGVDNLVEYYGWRVYKRIPATDAS